MKKIIFYLLMIFLSRNAFSQNSLVKLKKNIEKHINICNYKMSSWYMDTLCFNDLKINEYSFHQKKLGIALTDSLMKIRHYIYINNKNISATKSEINEFDNTLTMIFIYEAPTAKLAKEIDSSFLYTKEWVITKDTFSGYSFLFDKSIDHIYYSYDKYVICLLNFKAMPCEKLIKRLIMN